MKLSRFGITTRDALADLSLRMNSARFACFLKTARALIDNDFADLTDESDSK